MSFVIMPCRSHGFVFRDPAVLPPVFCIELLFRHSVLLLPLLLLLLLFCHLVPHKVIGTFANVYLVDVGGLHRLLAPTAGVPLVPLH